MSYDLRAATHEKPGQAELDSWLRDRESFRLEGSIEEGGLRVTRRHGKRFEHSFELSSPTPILDLEDIDEELARSTAAPRWFTEISAPHGLPDQDYAAARSLAKHLAQECRGAAFDPQSERVLWPPKSRKRVVVPSISELIRVVHLKWLFNDETMADTAVPRELLRLLRIHLGEAAPTRYGEYEPPRRRFEEKGDEGFKEFWQDVRGQPLNSFFWKAKAPCFGGTISFPSKWARPEDGRAAGYVKISLDGRVLERDDAYRAAAVNLFTAVAIRLRAFYAAAYIERNVEARRGNLWYGPSAEFISLMGKAWQGIPREPVWISYFGPEYVEQLGEALSKYETLEVGEGRLLRLGELPSDRDELKGRYPSFPSHLVAPPEEHSNRSLQLPTTGVGPSLLKRLKGQLRWR